MMSQFNIGHFSSFFNRAWNLVYTWVLIWLFKCALMGKAGHLYSVSSGVRLGNRCVPHRYYKW
ncbi:hypothetical protein BofuT4_uP067040.1 [Botrytis cinerea T4]|uniref:Uncharacterized protein n=1 Tax=Botryotinia fuckeliana (strain T4) TaxID=999810 RepID=G2XRC8_BOTF4|nr:hypothetical protein BofuT4_uP067040.1 [Botrytis cinerea T4]